MGLMPDSNIPVNTNYSPERLAAAVVWPHNVLMKNLKNLRQAKRLSQTELAEKVGCSQGMISKIEKGDANPTLDLIEAIADALGTTPASVFGLPELQQRVLVAIENIDPAIRPSALIVLEKMAEK